VAGWEIEVAGFACGFGGRSGQRDVGKFPGRAIFEQPGNEGGVHGVAGADGDDVAFEAAAGEGEIADEVEDFVADELVGEAQGSVDGAGFV